MCRRSPRIVLGQGAPKRFAQAVKKALSLRQRIAIRKYPFLVLLRGTTRLSVSGNEVLVV